MSINDHQIEDFIQSAVICIGWTARVETESGDYFTEEGEIIEHADESAQWDELQGIVERENREELESFVTEHYESLLSLSPDFSQHGHDYVLTAGRHGAGFWDRGYPAEIEGPITRAAHAGTGSHTVWADESGRLHYQQG